MFIAPFDKNYVFAFFVDHITNHIFFVSLMFDDYFVTRNIRSVHSDIQNVVPGSITIHLETVLTADKGLLETFAANLDL